jgi:uncharacterized protein YggE
VLSSQACFERSAKGGDGVNQFKIFFRSAMLGSLSVMGFLSASSSDLFARAQVDLEAKTLSIVASGEASAPAEIVTISVTLSSYCYESPVLARDANAQNASGVFEKLKEFALTEESPTASGVWIAPDDRYQMAQNGTGSELVCPGKWQASQSLSLSTRAIEKTAEIQEALYVLLQAMSARPSVVPSLNSPVTKMTMSAPYADVKKQTRRQLELLAIKNAIRNAKQELELVSGEFDFTQATLVGYRSSASSSGPEIYARSAAKSSPDSPVAFDKVTVQETREFIFKFN